MEARKINEKEITGFRLDWYDCGLHAPGPESHIRTRFNRLKGILSIGHMKTGSEFYYETRIPVSEEMTEKFFRELSSVNWQEDYTVEVCDGFSWEMRLKSGTAVVTKSSGTVYAPPETEKLEKMLREMIEESGCLECPMFWGSTPEEDDEE